MPHRAGVADTSELVARLTGEATTVPPLYFTAAQLDDLPPPVTRYFRSVLREGQPVVRWARVSWRGTFLMRPEPDGWRPFTADQQFAPRPGGFVWDARVRMAPGVTVRVRDAFVDGAGSMRASGLGLWRVVAVEGTPEITSGALQRYRRSSPNLTILSSKDAVEAIRSAPVRRENGAVREQPPQIPLQNLTSAIYYKLSAHIY